MTSHNSDFIQEVYRISEAAEKKGLQLRVMGALATRIHSPNSLDLANSLKRVFTDIDFMGYWNQNEKVQALFPELGYEPRERGLGTVFLTRHVFYDQTHKRVAEVFYDKLQMCHTVNFKGRLELDFPTIPLTDLVLTKLQIVQLNEKDAKDLIVLFREHDVDSKGKETIDGGYISDIMSKEWGFYYTATTNLKKIIEYLPKFDVLKEKDMSVIKERVQTLHDAIEKKPKSLSWKLRARVGPKKKWYNDVEDMTHEQIDKE